MPVLDWIFLAVLLLSMLLGAWRGLVFELLSLLSWIAAFVLAQWLGPDVAHMLPLAGAAEVIRYVAGFLVVFVATVFAGGLIAWGIKQLVQAVGLRPADRALGAVFGLVRGVILLLAATVVMEMTPLKSSEWWQQSRGAEVSSAALKGLKPVLPEEFGKYLP
jgi:membrane protein required for colicin V production